MPRGKKMRTTFNAGRIPRADRIQRLTIGGALMMLTVSGLSEHVNWQGIVAIVLQTELLLTGIAGWCPVYWMCRAMKNEMNPNRHRSED